MEGTMSVYMVERNLGGIAMEDLAAAQRAAINTAKDMRAAGDEINYLHSAFIPGDGRCMCFFEGESADKVKSLNDRAGLPYERVVEAMHLAP
jgi:hypothetical protein